MSKENRDLNNYIKLISEIRQFSPENFPNFIIGFGGEDFFLTDLHETIKKIWREANYSYESEELTFESFSTLCNQKSLFDPVSMITVKRCEKNPNIKEWLAKIKNPPGQFSSRFCLLFQEKTLNKKLEQELNRLKAFFVPCFSISLEELASFIKWQSQVLHLKFSEGAIDYLIQAIGANCFKIKNELHKLSLIFDNKDQVIQANEIAPYLGVLREDHAFKISNLLLEKKFAEVQTLVNELLRRGEKEVNILGIFVRHLRITMKFLEALRSRRNIKEVDPLLRLPFFVIKSYTNYVQKKKLTDCYKILSVCRDVDLAIKSTDINPDLLLGQIINAFAEGLS